MTKIGGSKSPFELGASLSRNFVDGIQWPVDRASLTALVDLGLSDAQIATYFSVEPADVLTRRQYFGLDLGPR